MTACHPLPVSSLTSLSLSSLSSLPVCLSLSPAGNLFAGGPSSVIVSAFKWAAAVRPDLRLCINDYSLLETDRCECVGGGSCHDPHRP